ncbi:MAG: presqualene diphosphate synthase HpnD [Candidatus Binatus sp.]|uniref:presqualene diphosphate synthase HpnD n=1 Tax=Candidatus Binatus sp. TaxID=2811406 RepID=UPI0027178D99|nr:presqualene diphosphate synthase HpnD [Candidatus Binatus sp.]MDO8430840.1 presqualene diphosphate synthase HpnD [Candidatus Binatus sp.]
MAVAASASSSAHNGALLEADYERCAQVTRRSSSNFYYAFMLLPAERRRALHAVYAFCRFVDDIADDESVRDPAYLLDKWRDELGRVYAGDPTRPVSRALADSVRRFRIPRRHFEDVIAGVEMDLSRDRYPTFEELRLYCYRVASAVGLICIEIFGYRNPSAKSYAENLGIAFQLTNILRDVREDAGRKRIYLPLEDLKRFGVSEDDILRGVYSGNFVSLMDFEAKRARQFYELALGQLAPEDRATLLTAEAMRLIYGALLERIIKSNYRVLDRRHSLSAPHKLYLVGRAWAASRLSARIG